ncbi:S-adenosyl-L-methionine-dependent tRNA 4-demethylwyosine synthase [uncultured archaeon]|nr:S-adenosyl-L-methionine-dependent tRNA 4-demethylwyosine synthase [uncultured archaeon]
MLPEKVQKSLEKQHYRIVGKNKHSAVQICQWTKKAIRGEDCCYKEKFYGIKSHRCCQMTPSLWCPNQCLHCWRAIEFTTGEKIPGQIDSAKEIVDGCIEAQRNLLRGFKILPETRYKTRSKANMKKWEEAQEPMQFAISLSGEPTIYPNLGELIKELRKRKKTSFLVTNGLYPEVLKKLEKKKQLPTQVYVSVNAPNERLYDKFHRSTKKDAWKKLNETLEFLPRIRKKTRTVFRINLVKDLNMSNELIPEYAQLIKKSRPQFIEIKGFMHVGFAKERLRYEQMPWHREVKDFAKKLSVELKRLKENYKILDEFEYSRVLVMGKDKKELKIKENEI